MKQELTTNQAAEMLRRDENANWSYNGAIALVEYLEELEDSCDMEINFNVVDIRCEYFEFEDVEDLFMQYFTLIDVNDYVDFEQTNEDLWNVQRNETKKYKLLDEDAKEEFNTAFMDELHNNTQVIEFDGGIIIADF